MKCMREDLEKRIKVDLHREWLEEVKSFRCVEVTIALNEGIKSDVNNKVNKRCEWLGGMKNRL